MGQISWTITLVMIGLFAVAILGFAVNFANDNNAAVDISSDADISSTYSSTTGNSSSFGDDAENTYSSIISSTIDPEGQTLESAGPVAISSKNMVGTVKNIFSVGFKRVFGGSGSPFEIFLVTFLGLIVFITAMVILKTFIGRNPE